MEPVQLRAPGLLLRVWQPEDAPEVLRALRDPEIARWNPAPAAAAGLAGALEWVRHRADWLAGVHASFAVTDAGTDALLGSVSVFRIQDEDATIGYWTVPAERNRGVASRAVATVTDWVFQSLGVYRLEICHAVANPGSCQVARRAGFPLEGTLRRSHRYGDGQRYDEHLHARLADDR